MEEVIQHARAHSFASVMKELSVSKLHNITFHVIYMNFHFSCIINRQIKKNTYKLVAVGFPWFKTTEETSTNSFLRNRDDKKITYKRPN